jgi:hypothetical protein
VQLLAIGLGIAVIVFVITAGHVIFLPLLFLPFGLFSLGHRRRRQQSTLLAERRQGATTDVAPRESR